MRELGIDPERRTALSLGRGARPKAAEFAPAALARDEAASLSFGAVSEPGCHSSMTTARWHSPEWLGRA